jgi:hypothetical protein
MTEGSCLAPFDAGPVRVPYPACRADGGSIGHLVRLEPALGVTIFGLDLQGDMADPKVVLQCVAGTLKKHISGMAAGYHEMRGQRRLRRAHRPDVQLCAANIDVPLLAAQKKRRRRAMHGPRPRLRRLRTEGTSTLVPVPPQGPAIRTRSARRRPRR